MSDTKKTITILISGLLLSFGSFFLYFYPENKIWGAIILLSVLDILFLWINAFIFLEFSDKRILKSTLLSLGFILLINIGGLILLYRRISEVWMDTLFVSLFLGPCLIFIIAVIFLLILLYDYAYGTQFRK